MNLTVTAGPMFYLLATIMVVAALGVVLARNMVHAALWLALVLLMAGGLYLNLAADLLAGFQVLIYVGAVITLVLIAVMLVSQLTNREVVQTNGRRLPAAVVAAAGAAMLCWVLGSAEWPPVNPALASQSYDLSLRMLCYALLDKYLLPFEVASLLLLVALVGAVVFAQHTHAADKARALAAAEAAAAAEADRREET
jgi:NADH:ubiquinone oxidoreductase subunit 6 (subunit J)